MNRENDSACAAIDPATTAVRAPAPRPADGIAATRAGVRVDRAVTELRRGRPVLLRSGPEELLVAAVETLMPSTWLELTGQGRGVTLTLTAERVQATGWHKPTLVTAVTDGTVLPLPVINSAPIGSAADAPAPLLPISLWLPASFEPARLVDLAGIGSHGSDAGGASTGGTERFGSLLAIQPAPPAAQTTPAMRAALELARLARLVPAIVTADGLGSRPGAFALADGFRQPEAGDPHHLRVSGEDIFDYAQERASSLLRVSEAPVPLAGHEDSRFVLFRETVADLEHVAIIVGNPDPASPVMVRLHSSCLTGDLFASLRCDCGDQLRGAIHRLGEGGGVLLYLAQEGRGIGLANKLRAYARQDAGMDTIDADRYLGFRGDERNFAVAAQILHSLGIARIRLLTNNPSKIAALRQAGLDVVERLPIGGQINRHNERYIATKRDRAGHLIDVPNPPAARQAG